MRTKKLPDTWVTPEVTIDGTKYYLVPEGEYKLLWDNLLEHSVDGIEFANASIGRGLRQRREKAGLTQKAVATKAGIRLETLNRLENGHGNPTASTIRKILKALGEKA